MPENPIVARRRAEWERIRRIGLPTFLFVRGVLVRGIPTALVLMLLLELLQGRGSIAEWLRDPGFLGRLAIATLLFSIGGMIAAYARWRALDSQFGEGAGGSGGG